LSVNFISENVNLKDRAEIFKHNSQLMLIHRPEKY
jgi:hypothetical protein